MAIGRSRYAPPVSTKGHSVLKTRSYGLSTRAAPPPSASPRSSAYSTRAEEYLLADRVSNVNYLSNALLDQGYDTAVRSRGRDQALLNEATNAIPTRGAVRSTAAVSSSLPSFGGSRRFPRRFGKAGVRKNKSLSLYGTSLPEEGNTAASAASPSSSPVSVRRRFGRSASAVRAYLAGDTEDLPGSCSSPPRASSVGPSPMSSPSPSRVASSLTLARSRRALSSAPSGGSRVSDLIRGGVGGGGGGGGGGGLGGGGGISWGQSVSAASSYSQIPRRPFENPFQEFEDDDIAYSAATATATSPTTPRRRPKVLSTSRRPAGNYYEKLLRKRGKKHGRFGPYYDVESIEGSDLSGVLSDREDTFEGTYGPSPLDSEIGNDASDPYYESSVLSSSSSPSPSRRYLSSSTALSPYSPYFVDQDTEFVPFKPSRPLQTKGLLEITPLFDPSNDDSENNTNSYSNSSSHRLPSPTTDLSLSRYLPSSLVSAARSSSSDSPTATLTSRLPFRSLVSYTSSSPLSPSSASAALPDESLAVVPSSSSSSAAPPTTTSSSSSYTPNTELLENLVANAVQRARNAINDLAIPDYSGASLLLSVEGAGTSPDGKRVDFTYTPPPIPLYGKTLGLDDPKFLGIRPRQSIKPLDDFIAGYMERMGALRAALTERRDKDRERRAQYGLKPLDTGPSAGDSPYSSSYSSPYSSSTRSYRSYTPSYTQSHDYVPVKHLSSQRLEHLPVTSFRKSRDDGATERLDVFSLGEFRPRLSSSTARAITIPESATGGYKLSVLDKINIKAAIIASKMEPDPIKRRRPRSEYATNKYREMRREKMESPTHGGSAASGGSRASS